MKKSISVVIPTFNGKKLLEENIPTVLSALEHENIDFELIICDDASTDETIEFISEKYPSILILKNEINKGFSPTINLGILAAKKELVFILNNDVKLTNNYFHNQFKYFENKSTFGVMGKIVGTNGETQDTAKFPDYSGIKIKGSTNYEIEQVENDFWIPTFMLSGANALIDRAKIQLLKGFDVIYAPFYWEDVDLSIRAWRLGWECFYDENSICIHPSSSTIGKLFKKKDVSIVSNRNKFILHKLHLDTNKQFSFKLKLFLKFILSVLLFKNSYIKSYFMYKSLKTEITKSQNELKRLFEITRESYTLAKVQEKILLKIQHKKLNKF